MLRFECDYGEGAHPEILKRLNETNFEQTAGYGQDPYCESAREKIRAACQAPDAQVHFLVGGTQANATVIGAALRPHQGALCAKSGHINVHETGAIEALGHKVLTLPEHEGKLDAREAEAYVRAHYADETHEHMVQPGLIYISHPTEYGTLYTLQELEALSAVCRAHGMFLYVDGARMGYGLAAGEITLPDFARLCDAFLIGGTKCGALLGEAVVLTHPALQRDFRYHIKQRGGMLAKGRLLGLQFDTLFENDLYTRIAAQAVARAQRVRKALLARGIGLLIDSPTNQLFPILTRAQAQALAQTCSFSHWQQVDDERDAVRLCLSWATGEEQTAALIRAIENLPA